MLGAEHRAEGTDNEPSKFYNNGDFDNPISFGQTVPILPVKGSFRTNELFGELNADVISPSNDIPFVHSLDLQAAARYVHHSVSGGALPGLRGDAMRRSAIFRSGATSLTRSVRRPFRKPLFRPARSSASRPTPAMSTNSPTALIRRRGRRIAPLRGFRRTSSSQANSRSFLQSTGGNPDLKNESSNAYSIGGVVTPRIIPGLNLSVDYVNVKLKKAISPFSGSDVVNACYDAPDPASNPFCQLFTRNLSGTPDTNPNFGQLTFIQTSFFNAAELHYRGIIASLDYKVRTPFLGRGSSLGLSGSYQHLLELSTIANAGAAKANGQGTLGYPKDLFVVTVNYLNGPLSLFTNFNYTGPVNQLADEPKTFREFERIKSFLVVNGGGTMDVNHRFRFFVDIDNVFNVGPPYPVPTIGGGAVTYFPESLAATTGLERACTSRRQG